MKVVLFVVLGLFVCLSVCDKVNFTLRFKGQCVDSNHNLLKIKCDAKAYSQSITTVISTSDAISMSVTEGDGNYALWNFNVTGLGKVSSTLRTVVNMLEFKGEETFVGIGMMSFGSDTDRNHTLNFRSLGVGFTTKTNETLTAGLIGLFGIDGSGGVFQDATGTITINGRLNYYTRELTVYVNGVAHAAASAEEIEKRLGLVRAE